MLEQTGTLQEQYMDSFRKMLSQLTEQQRQAVETIEGPVLVIAGPGTGKTHILAARVGQILLETDSQPHNILCLTFSDSAVTAMRNRLLQFMGADAYRVHIYTFHSFCNRVIQENIELFGRRDSEPLSELERIEIIRQLLLGLPKDHILRQSGHPFFYESHLQHLFAKMKSENWSATYISDQIDQYLEDIPNKKEFVYQINRGNFHKGDLKESAVQTSMHKMELLRAAAELFNNYNQLLLQRHRHDYEDMLRWVLDAFKQNEFLLRRYQEQYLYILVDEFQDTNTSQYQILRLLVSYWEDRPNLFLVGDDDQSVYEFQGARLQNMIDFYEEYLPELQWIILQENFRSTPAIIKAAQQLIRGNDIRIVRYLQTETPIEKDLRAAHPLYANATIEPVIEEYPSALQEEIGIVQKIKKWHSEGIPYKEIAVLYARHKQAKVLMRLMDKAGIPYSTRRRINMLELPWAQQLLQLFRYLQYEMAQAYSGEELFYELLFSEFVGLPLADIHTLVAFYSRELRRNFNKNSESSEQRGIFWRDLIRQPKTIAKLHLQKPSKIEAFATFLDEAIFNYRNQSLPEWTEWLINRSGLLQYLVHHPQKDTYLPALYTFFDFIYAETLKKPQVHLADILDMVHRMEDNHLGLYIHASSYTDDGVQLMTAHSSKGLQFRCVVIAHAIKDYWEGRQESGNRQFGFPDTLVLSNETDAEESARRLFYVAMTRAQEHLVISYHQFHEDKKIVKTAKFVDELRQHLPTNMCAVPPDEVRRYQLALLQSSAMPNAFLLPDAVMNDLLADFKMSVSALNTYLNCPTAFYFEYVLRLPYLPSEEAVYGIAVHSALKKAFDAMQRNAGQIFPPIEDVLQWFEADLRRECLGRHDSVFQRLWQQGQQWLPMYYRQRLPLWKEQVKDSSIYTERPFRNAQWNGIPITGTIDKVVVFHRIDRQYIHVTDYKSGKLDEKRLQPPSKSEPYGGGYWRQLYFYKLLLDRSPLFSYSTQVGEIDYLTRNGEEDFPIKQIQLTDAEMQQFKDILKTAYKKIGEHQFEEGCGSRTCKSCALVKRSYNAISHRNEVKEQADDNG